MARCLPAGLLLLLLPAPALADAPCAINTYGNSGDAEAIAIHAGPAADSPVVGLAPHGLPGTEFDGEAAFFTVVAMQDGWAQVMGGQSADDETALPDGWVDGARLTFVAQTEMAFAGPDPASGPVVPPFRDWPVAEALLDCSGDWALIRFADYHMQGNDRIIAGYVTGWVRGICASQRTTCDGTYGDHAP